MAFAGLDRQGRARHRRRGAASARRPSRRLRPRAPASSSPIAISTARRLSPPRSPGRGAGARGGRRRGGGRDAERIVAEGVDRFGRIDLHHLNAGIPGLAGAVTRT